MCEFARSPNTCRHVTFLSNAKGLSWVGTWPALPIDPNNVRTNDVSRRVNIAGVAPLPIFVDMRRRVNISNLAPNGELVGI